MTTHMQIVTDVDVAIIGGGVHGITAAAFLLQHGVVTPGRLAIIDPSTGPLGASVLAERFRDCATVQLRSRLSDHCGCSDNHFEEFVRSSRRESELVDGKRPKVKLFLDHTRSVVVDNDLEQALLRARAVWLDRTDDGVLLVRTNAGVVRANRVHLCLGQVAPAYPDWARELRGHDPRISHIFDRDYELSELPPGERVIVVGGGITAAQVACSIAENGRRVLLLTRRPLAGGSGLGSEDWKDPERRLQMLCSLPWGERFNVLRQHGDRGTVPPWELERIARLQDRRCIEHEVCDVEALIPSAGAIELIRRDGFTYRGDVTVLATGLASELPSWLAASARSLGLPFDDRGRPQLENTLEWGAGSCIFMHGVHAAPVIGPFAANISGARIAALLTVQQHTCRRTSRTEHSGAGVG